MTQFPQASVLEGVEFTAAVGVPNVVQGLFRKRELLVKAATIAHTDALGFKVASDLVAKYGPGPFYVRVAKDNALLVTEAEDIKFVLGNSPALFASDPPAKKAGMSAFQPYALTISRSPLWEQRRAFAESVLDAASPTSKIAAGFLPVVTNEITDLGASFDWPALNAAIWRITRTVLFGESAPDDTEITEVLGGLMAEGNRTPGKPGRAYPELVGRISDYIAASAPGSLAALAGKSRAKDVEPAGQMVHWMFAMGDTLAANLMRTFALLATHPEQLREARIEVDNADLGKAADVAGLAYVAGCLADTMRLFPTTALFGRVTTSDVTFPDGAVVPADTQVLIYNLFNHRDSRRFDYADKFAPGEWSGGEAGSEWAFNFFSHGPQGCPGASLAMFLGQAVIAQVLTTGDPSVEGTSVRRGHPLPHAMELAPLAITLH